KLGERARRGGGVFVPPPPPDSGPGGGDGCRKPEIGGMGRARPPAPGLVPPAGGDGECRWTPDFLVPAGWRSAPYDALSVGLNFGKAPRRGTEARSAVCVALPVPPARNPAIWRAGPVRTR